MLLQYVQNVQVYKYQQRNNHDHNLRVNDNRSEHLLFYMHSPNYQLSIDLSNMDQQNQHQYVYLDLDHCI